MRKFPILLAALAAGLLATAPAFATGPTCIQGTAGVAPTATLTFTAPTTYTDGTAISGTLTYEIFQGSASGQETLVSKAVAGSPVTINTGLADGTTVYWYVESVDAAGTASAPSNEVCKTFPAGVPRAVTITIT